MADFCYNIAVRKYHYAKACLTADVNNEPFSHNDTMTMTYVDGISSLIVSLLD